MGKSIWKINWREKFENLIEISEELDLGLDSFVFWDDNPIERDKMKSFLPDVTTIDAPADVFEWKDYLNNLDCLSKFLITEDDLKKELVQQVRKEIGPIATFDVIQWAPGLPKTRSGKIMRRILRKIAENDMGSIGDTSTLADPSVVEDLIANRPA